MNVNDKVEIEWLILLSRKTGLKLEDELNEEELEKLRECVK